MPNQEIRERHIMLKVVTKASGEIEDFDENKVIRSLKKAGAQEKIIEKILHQIQKLPDRTSTQQIYSTAFESLKNAPFAVAARYNIKQALYDLGPTGYPFEQYVSHIFKQQNYSVSVSQKIDGYCVTHEIDIVAKKNDAHLIIECKFHNRYGLKSDIKTSLYVQARFEDIQKGFVHRKGKHVWDIHTIILVTNTKFTTDAISYGKCVGIKMIGWAYPPQENLAYFIERYSLFPITALTTLNKHQKIELINNGVVLCQEICKNETRLQQIESNEQKRNQIFQEARDICRTIVS